MKNSFIDYISFPLDFFNQDEVEKRIVELQKQHKNVYMYMVLSFELEETGAVFSTSNKIGTIEALDWYEKQRSAKQ